MMQISLVDYMQVATKCPKCKKYGLFFRVSGTKGYCECCECGYTTRKKELIPRQKNAQSAGARKNQKSEPVQNALKS